MTDPIRVLIADDHPLFRDGLTAMLQADDDTELAGAATDGLQAVELALHSQPTSWSWTCTCPAWTASRRPAASWPTARTSPCWC
jgi:CheY-like chemotaxis protein